MPYHSVSEVLIERHIGRIFSSEGDTLRRGVLARHEVDMVDQLAAQAGPLSRPAHADHVEGDVWWKRDVKRGARCAIGVVT